MTQVRARLEELGLDEYTDVFISEGFDSWDTLVRITEDDLKDLNVKLGHRRKLQKAIADWKQEFEAPTASFGRLRTSTGSSSAVVENGSDVARLVKHNSEGDQSAGSNGRTKRKYRRHPKPDPNAPERPVSAYVLFSNYMRDLLKEQDLSFTEMAKIVGEKWQLLPMETREQYERQAASAKEKYNAELAEYKKTDQYAQYQLYLADFKARHSAQAGDDKRARLRTESSNDTQSSRESHDSYSYANRRKSVNSLYSAGSTTSDTARQDSPQYSSHASPTSARRSYPHHSSPDGHVTSYPSAMRPHHSDPAALDSPKYPHHPGSDSMSSPRRRFPYLHNDSDSRSPSDSLPPTSSSSAVPSLSHQNSTDSSVPPSASNDRQSRSPSSPIHSLMTADASRRVLPPPHQTAAPVRPLEHRPSIVGGGGPSDLPLPPPDPRSIPSLAALLQAGELAREAEMRNAAAAAAAATAQQQK